MEDNQRDFLCLPDQPIHLQQELSGWAVQAALDIPALVVVIPNIHYQKILPRYLAALHDLC
jgi:hypothetical protein